MIRVTTTAAKAVAPPIDSVRLTLNLREARILHTIVGNIGGRNSSEARQFIDQLYNALAQAGVQSFGFGGTRLWDTPDGSVQFKDVQDFSDTDG